MRKCELCKAAAARIYCDSDRALLCWNCDARVHSANFLVARHFRNLLCHVCQSPTTWNASGSRLCPGMSICIRCVTTTTTTGCDPKVYNAARRRVRVEKNEDIQCVCMEEVMDENGGDEDDHELMITNISNTATATATTTTDDDDGENQVAPPPPPLSSSSEGGRFWNSLKRMRGNNPDLKSDDDEDEDEDVDSGMSELSSRASVETAKSRYISYEEEKSCCCCKSTTMMEEQRMAATMKKRKRRMAATMKKRKR